MNSTTARKLSFAKIYATEWGAERTMDLVEIRTSYGLMVKEKKYGSSLYNDCKQLNNLSSETAMNLLTDSRLLYCFFFVTALGDTSRRRRGTTLHSHSRREKKFPSCERSRGDFSSIFVEEFISRRISMENLSPLVNTIFRVKLKLIILNFIFNKQDLKNTRNILFIV